MEHINSDQDDWDIPYEFEGAQLPEWPKDVLPEIAQRYIEELSRSTETPIELGAMIFLSVVATAAQKKYTVEIKKSYREPVNIWVLPILPPASRKSNIFTEISFPIHKWEEQQKIVLEPIFNAQTSKQKTLEEKIKHLRCLAAKTKSDAEFDGIQKQISILESEIINTLTFPQLWTSDITPEHLGALMATNDEAMAVLSDEGGIFDILAGLYSNGRANIDLFLQSHSGSSVRVGRQSKPPIFLKNALLTMGITAQPHVIKTAYKNVVLRSRGLLGRFLYVIPESNIGYRTLEEKPMEDSIKVQFYACITAILNHPKISNNSQAKHILVLEPEAYLKWLSYAKTIEAMMNPDLGYLSHITDWAGKLSGQIARIAALLHIFRYALECPWERNISLKDMEAAVKIGHALISHTLKVFSSSDEEDGILVAKDLLQWIANFNIEHFTLRDCLRKFRKYNKKALQPGINILKDRGYLHEGKSQPIKGAPSTMFYVNPKSKSMGIGQ